MNIYAYVAMVIVFFFTIFSLFLFTDFYIKTTKTYYFRIFLFISLILLDIWGYVARATIYPYKSHRTLNIIMDLEYCNMSLMLICFSFFFPIKFVTDCTLPMGIVGPFVAAMLGNWDHCHFRDTEYWRFYLLHIMLMFSYVYLYAYGLTKTCFNKVLVIRSILYAVIVGLIVEIYNQVFDGTNIYQTLAVGFLGKNKKEIYYFLFSISWIFPATHAAAYLAIWHVKPIYNRQIQMKTHETWCEKLISAFKKTY